MSEEKRTEFKPIDIREIFYGKSPRIARIIPGFIYNYLKKRLHLDHINGFLQEHGKKRGYDFIEAVLEEFNVSLDVTGENNMPAGGRNIFVSNHPLGGFDGMLIINYLGKRYKEVKTLTNDILMNIENLAELFVPVNKHGVQSSEVVKAMDGLFNSEAQIMTFPAGIVSRRKKGIIRDVEWKKTFITRAIRHERDIVPMHISGRCTGFFYRLANIRSFLGIKYNLEMFFLPDETYKHRNEEVSLTIGKPVSWKTFDKRYTPVKWALKMQGFCYSLPANPERTFEQYLEYSEQLSVDDSSKLK